MAKLTKKQQCFVEEYLIDLCATQAAIRAGYSPKTARSIANEILTKPDIQDAVDKALAQRSRRTGITADRVLNELAKLAFVNITDVVDLSNAKAISEASRDDTAAISSIKIKKIPTVYGEIEECEVKLYDKKGALDSLSKHLGIGAEKQAVVVEIEDITPLADMLGIGGADDGRPEDADDPVEAI